MIKVKAKNAKRFLPGFYVVMQYMEDQNEPSKPERELVYLRDVDGLRNYLQDFLVATGNEDELDLAAVIEEPQHEFCDIDLDNDGLHILLTRVESIRNDMTKPTPPVPWVDWSAPFPEGT